MRLELWVVKQPNGAVHLTQNRPERSSEDGFWVDEKTLMYFPYSESDIPATDVPRRITLTSKDLPELSNSDRETIEYLKMLNDARREDLGYPPLHAKPQEKERKKRK
jgi:hypothetical protein